MLSQNATIVESTDDYLVLEPEQGGCNACGEGKSGGCGVSNLSAFFQQRSRLLKVSNPGGFRSGQQVEILLAEPIFLAMLATQYLLPLLSMLLVAVIVGLFSSAIGWQLFAVAVGLYFGIQLSKYITNRMDQSIGLDDLGLRALADTNIDQIQHIKVLAS